jgi:hypothetical protein
MQVNPNKLRVYESRLGLDGAGLLDEDSIRVVVQMSSGVQSRVGFITTLNINDIADESSLIPTSRSAQWRPRRISGVFAFRQRMDMRRQTRVAAQCSFLADIGPTTMVRRSR